MRFSSSIVGATRPLAGSWLLLAVWSLVAGCGLEPPSPVSGLREFEREAVQRIGEVRVHLAGGNLSTERVDLVLDTRLGPLEAAAVYNSASRAWLWRHEMRMHDGVFVDESGAELDVSAIADGRAIPGTRWVRVDATHMKTKGGLVHGFDPVDGRLVEVHWSDGPYPRLRFEAEPIAGAMRTVRIEQCVDAASCGVQMTFAYDVNGCVASVVDRADRMAEYVHDAACRTRVARDAFDVERGLAGRLYEYGGAGRLRAIVTSEGERTELDHVGDAVTAVRRIGAADPTHHFTYVVDPVGPTSTTIVTTPSGDGWRFAFDERRRLVWRASPEGDVVAQTWSGLRPASRTDAAGETWRFAYADDDLTRLETPSGRAVLRVYAPDAVDRARPDARPVDRTMDVLGTREQRVYDEAGRLVMIIDGVGEITTLTWDALGQLATLTGPDGRQVSFHDYGEHGHATRIRRGEIEETRLFDGVGNLEKGEGLAGELGPGRPGMVRRRFDADRNVAEVVTGETELITNGVREYSTLIERRSDGRPLRITKPYGGAESFTYDALGRLVERRERVDGIDHVTTVESDLEGRLIRTVLPNGMETQLERDGDGRIVRIDRRRPGVPSDWMTLAYEGGRAVRVDDRAYAQPETIEYDVDGRVHAIEHATGGHTEVDHDVRGRETRRRVYDGEYGALLFETARSWNGEDLPAATRLDGDLLVERAYIGGELRSMRFGNGLTRSFTHDSQTGELEATLTTLESGVIVERTTIERSACWTDKLCVGVRSGVWLAGAEGEAPLWNAAEEHFQLNWLPTTFGDSPLPGSWLRMTSHEPFVDITKGDRVQFDALGNLASYQAQDGPLVEFEFNAERNRLSAGGFETRHTFAYDEAGFVTERDGVPLGWTASGRVASIGDDVRLEWDLRGRPVSRTIDGETTRYGYGGSVEVDANGWPIATEIDGVRVVLGTPVRRYTHPDFRGNVLFVTDESGQVLRRHVYRGFGESRVVDRDGATRSALDGERGFAQGVNVAGLQLMGARPYDPDTGRFLAPDPIDHLLNDFSYTRGNPVRLWDPGGTHPVPVNGSPSELAVKGKQLEVGGTIVAMTGGAIAAAGVASGNPVAVFVGGVMVVVGVAATAVGIDLQAQDAANPPTLQENPPPIIEDSKLHEAGAEIATGCAPDGFNPEERSIGLARWLGLLAAMVLGLHWLRRREGAG